MTADKHDLQLQLRDMDDQLTAMIAIADQRQEHLLGALLCDAHACVVRRYAELATD